MLDNMEADVVCLGQVGMANDMVKREVLKALKQRVAKW